MKKPLGVGAVGARLGAAASVLLGAKLELGSPLMKSIYEIECFDKAGNLKWAECVENLVVNQGLNDLLEKYFINQSPDYSPAWYVGLIAEFSGNQIQASDTAAKIVDTASELNPPTTNDWYEWVNYDEATREVLTLGSVSSQSVSNSASRAEFTISAAGEIYGAFVISNNTKGGTSGILYGAAAFSSPRSVEDDDTLRVLVTLTAAAA